MALTGLQIQKLLPKTNCKECGSNTCLAFAMKLAAKKAELSQCPYASDEAKKVLGAASEPPVKKVSLGAHHELSSGAETVLYRHAKTFVHQTLLGINITDTDSDKTVEQTLSAIADYRLERVGEDLRLELAAITHTDEPIERLEELCRLAWKKLQRPLVVRSPQVEALKRAAEALQGSHSVLASSTPETALELQHVAQEFGHVLAVTAPNLDQLVETTTTLKSQGFTTIMLEFQTHSLAEQFQVYSIARRMALNSSYKPLGYPFLQFIEPSPLVESTAQAVTAICKYGGICILPSFNAAQLGAIMTLRQNIYTDPQRPIQVEPNVYAVGDPTPDSPVFVTTNFSLTYFMVSGEIENSGISAWLVVPECEGMSVLTSWAAGKFSGASIGKFIKSCGLEEQITTRQLIIPGYVAQISGELEESLPGWKVMVGPQEIGDLEGFVKARLM